MNPRRTMGDWCWGAREHGTLGSTGSLCRRKRRKVHPGDPERTISLFAGSGMLLPPAVPSPLTTNSAGFHVFNGDGTGSDFVTFSLNGIDQHVPSPVAITYTLNPDCTGTYSVPSASLDFDIFVAVDGSA